jgi:hypothetical protein
LEPLGSGISCIQIYRGGILDQRLRKEVEKQGANPEILLFLMGWTGFIHSEVADFRDEKYHGTFFVNPAL